MTLHNIRHYSRRTALALLAVFSAALPASVQAQSYPTKPIRVIVGFAAGGATDIMARLMQPYLQEILGQPIVIENRGGGGGNIGSEALVQAAPDGYTFMLASPGQLVVNPIMTKGLSFDVEKDILPVAQVTSGPLVMVVPANSPFKSLDDLVAYGKANPDKLDFASAGIGSSMHIAGEMLNFYGGMKAVHVPYRGSGPAVVDLVSGKVHFMIDSVSTIIGHVRSGNLRALAVTGAEAHPDFPGAPPISSKIPDVVLTTWLGYVAPKGTSTDVIARFADASAKVTQNPQFIAKVREMGSSPLNAGPAEFRRHLASERVRARKVIEAANIKPE